MRGAARLTLQSWRLHTQAAPALRFPCRHPVRHQACAPASMHSTHRMFSEVAPSSASQVDCVVIGAGVVGLAAARALSMRGLEVIIVEKEGAIGMGTSSRNSEVIHAGIYYPAGSMQAQMCVEGKAMLYDYCSHKRIPHRQTGKLVVATSLEQVTKLETIKKRGAANGVLDLSIIPGTEAMALEPELRCHTALLSPSTGIIDSHSLMECLLSDTESKGGVLVLGSSVVGGSLTGAQSVALGGLGGGAVGGTEGSAGVRAPAGRSRIRLQVREAASGEQQVVDAKYVVNSAGLDAPAVASRIQGVPASVIPTPYLAKGSYFSLSPPPSTSGGGSGSGPSRRAPFQRLVYPVPEPGGLGIHYTLDLAGNGKFGPDVEWVDEVDYSVDPKRAERFYASVRRYWPGLPDGALQPSYCGIRPKLTGPGQPDADFLIQAADSHGVHGLVNLLGIGSPGLTSSLAIGELVAETLLQGK